MTKLNLKNSYDVISVTSSPLRHRKRSPKLRHNFILFGPLQLKFLSPPVLPEVRANGPAFCENCKVPKALSLVNSVLFRLT